MRRGVLIDDWRQRMPAGTTVQARTLRLVSLADRAIGLQLPHIEVDGPPSEVTLEASFEGAGFGMATLRQDQDLGVWRTEQIRQTLAMGELPVLQLAGQERVPATPGPLTWRWTWTSAPGQAACLERFVATARGDAPDDDPAAAARGALTRATSIGWRAVLASHESAWADRWRHSDIKIGGDAAADQALRFAAIT